MNLATYNKEFVTCNDVIVPLPFYEYLDPIQCVC